MPPQTVVFRIQLHLADHSTCSAPHRILSKSCCVRCRFLLELLLSTGRTDSYCIFFIVPHFFMQMSYRNSMFFMLLFNSDLMSLFLNISFIVTFHSNICMLSFWFCLQFKVSLITKLTSNCCLMEINTPASIRIQ